MLTLGYINFLSQTYFFLLKNLTKGIKNIELSPKIRSANNAIFKIGFLIITLPTIFASETKIKYPNPIEKKYFVNFILLNPAE